MPLVVPKTDVAQLVTKPFQTGLPCRDSIFSFLFPGSVPLGLALATPWPLLSPWHSISALAPETFSGG